MFENILAWVGFAVLLFLCLPFTGTRKLVLEVSAWAVRLALVALLVGGAVLWFRPDLLPSQALTFLDRFPALQDVLPSPEANTFGLAAAALASAVLLPLLAVFDVTRRLAGDRMLRLRELTDGTRLEPATLPVAGTAEPVAAGQRTAEVAGTKQRRPDRRAAAETMAEVGSRKPYRVADQMS